MNKVVVTQMKVGVFTILAILTMIYMFIVLKPGFFDKKEFTNYYTILQNSSGIVTKTHVKTNGVVIGKVLEVKLYQNSTKIIFNIDKSIKIPINSKIEIRSKGLLGDVHLEIARAADEGQYILANQIIEQNNSGSDLGSLQRAAGSIAFDIKKITNALAKVIGSNTGVDSMKQIMSNMNTITKDFKITMETMRGVVVKRESEIDEMVINLSESIKTLKTVSRDLKDVLSDENRENFATILAGVSSAMHDVSGSVKKINLITQKIDEGKGTIGKLVNEDKALSQIEGAIKDFRKLLSPATKLQTDIDYHNEFGTLTGSQHFIDVLLKTRPDRYYLIGASDGKRKVVTEETEDKINIKGKDDDADDNDRSKQVTRTTVQNRIKINLQIAKRWYFATLRVGLFSSAGGFGLDFHLLDDKLRFSFEAFDWDLQNSTLRKTAHFKMYVNILFYNHIYLLAGIDDPTFIDVSTNKVRTKLNSYFGMGVRFTDNDIKTILGATALAR